MGIFHKQPFHKKLFYTVLSLFIVFLLSVFLFQYNREKEFRKELLNARLQKYNSIINENLTFYKNIDSLNIDSLQKSLNSNDLRITILTKKGKVLYDSKAGDNLDNHLSREEIVQAMKQGEGFALRKSSSMHQPYFYSAKQFNDYVIRSSLPFIAPIAETLRIDKHFIYFLTLTAILFIVILWSFSNKLGKSISILQEFSNKAEQGKPIYTRIKPENNEIGEITNNIIGIYHHLLQTKEELSIEKEKLIKHLQFSKEGLAVFSDKKKKIIANNLFIQYINLISDKQIVSIDDVFKQNDFQEITTFIDSNLNQKREPEEYRTHSLFLSKNGKAFQIECIIFQDNTFEISINNVTQQEEENRLKRQLTQNIAHELKTPVSSIQGYMETIIANPNLDNEKKIQFLNRCYAQTIRLAGLLRDISILNRIDESNDLFDKEKINLSTVIHEIVNDATIALNDRKMKAFADIPDNMLMEGNNSLLYSIFRNLMDNAIAYAGENTEIVIRCYLQDESYYYFSFSDNGCGVSEEHLNRLFERFYRVDKGRSRKLGGTGLGLAIVKNAIYFHKGEISAKNRPTGGLEFLFTLKK